MGDRHGSPHNFSYETHIQGLRAIAVIAVIVYHINNLLLPGGWCGVDVFFVISGYVVTRMLQKEYNDGASISILQFYFRRVKRLLPNSTLVLFAVLFFGKAFATIEAYGNWISASKFIVFYAGNFYFWQAKTNYYHLENVTLNPFLHFWSLGVEEQFYLVYPAFFYGIVVYCKAHTRIVYLIFLAATLLSFVGTLYFVNSSDDQFFVFYMLPTRIWQLLFGVTIASRKLQQHEYERPLMGVLFSFFGALLIFLSFLFYDDQTSTKWHG